MSATFVTTNVIKRNALTYSATQGIFNVRFIDLELYLQEEDLE